MLLLEDIDHILGPEVCGKKILSNKSTSKNKTSLLGEVRNGINSLHQSYNKSKKQSSKKINSLLQLIKQKDIEKEKLNNLLSKYQKYVQVLENEYTKQGSTIKKIQQQQQQQQQEYEDLEDLEIGMQPNEKSDRKLLAQRHPKYHYQRRNKNGKICVATKKVKPTMKIKNKKNYANEQNLYNDTDDEEVERDEEEIYEDGDDYNLSQFIN